MDPGAYCRNVESYLCRKNDGHLIRIVGPAFEIVCGWAARGVPLSVVRRGIDRTYEWYHAKGPKRRPVRIDYCEADVLDLFDEWRRAVGLGADHAPDRVNGCDAGDTLPRLTARRRSLAAHLDQVITRLTVWRSARERPTELDLQVAAVVQDLGVTRAEAQRARGEVRRRLVRRLGNLERALLESARVAVGDAQRRCFRLEAERDLAPFRDRMPSAAFRQAVDAGTDRLVFGHFELPRLTFD